MDLQDLDGTVNGFRIDGENANDGGLTVVSDAGDINGDGFDDIVIANASGKTYIVFGTDEGFPPELDLASLDGSNGFIVTGSLNFFGGAANSAGDVNGDGVDDLIIGAPQASPNGESSGSSFIIFGAAIFSATFDVDDLDGTNGFSVDGVAIQDDLGKDVSTAGDINGDGFDDILIGAFGVDTNGYNSGAAYVIFGSDENYPAAINVASLDGNIGFRINGEFIDSRTGWSVSNAGDVNNDGIDDIFISAPHVGTTTGGSYIVFGTETGFPATLELALLDGSNGFRIENDVGDEASGMPVSAAGDVNGDGIDDIIMGSPGTDPHGINSGSAYVIFGKSTPFSGTLNLSTINGTNGFRIDGSLQGDFLGSAVSGAGDFNGDGFDDLIVGAKYADPNGHNSGAVYIVFGTNTGLPATLDVSILNYKNGFPLEGLAGDDELGYSVSAAGDVNGDGFDDLIVAARGADANGSFSGSSYVIFGRASLVTEGTTGNDTLFGTQFGDVIFALAGLDSVSGLAGNDVIHGDAGNDVLDGGDGNDTLEGNAGSDTLQGGNGNNSLDGGAENDSLTAGYGHDTLLGGDGNDTLTAGPGVNTLDGGAGNDTANYAGASAGLTITLAPPHTQVGNFETYDTLFSIENVIGSNFNDTLGGNDLPNVLTGGGGTDFLVGLGGNDTLSGGDDNDFQLDGGLGNDIINGGAGLDTVIYFGAASGVTVNLATGQATGGFGNDTLIAIESVNGSAYNDTLTGDANGNSLSGEAGNDSLAGGAGDDFLYGGAGNDTVNGGNGTDMALFSSFSGVTVDLRIAGAQVVGGGLGTDTLISIESLSGSNGNDALTGTTGNNTLNGVSGNDTLIGLAGLDTLSGGNGNDTLNGGGGNDVLAGGGGIDTAIFSGVRAAYSITRSGGQVFVSGPDGADTLTNVEKLVFNDATVSLSKAGNDFNGDGKSDILWQIDDGSAAVWLLDGYTQTAGGVVGTNPGAAWHIKASGDFNGDGRFDILWQQDGGFVMAWLMNGLSRIGNGQLLGNPGPDWQIKGSGDFNADGKSDILWQNDGGAAAVWLLDGSNVIGGDVIGSNLGATWHVRGTGDFNGDGKSDILWQHDDGQVAVWLLDGLSLVGSGTVGNDPGDGWNVKASGDFNGDGKADLLWQNDDGRAAAWLLDGFTIIGGDVVGNNPGTAWQVKGVGDYNGDGKSDIVWQHVSGQAAIWVMDGMTAADAGLVGLNQGATWHVI